MADIEVYRLFIDETRMGLVFLDMVGVVGSSPISPTISVGMVSVSKSKRLLVLFRLAFILVIEKFFVATGQDRTQSICNQLMCLL